MLFNFDVYCLTFKFTVCRKLLPSTIKIYAIGKHSNIFWSFWYIVCS